MPDLSKRNLLNKNDDYRSASILNGSVRSEHDLQQPKDLYRYSMAARLCRTAPFVHGSQTHLMNIKFSFPKPGFSNVELGHAGVAPVFHTLETCVGYINLTKLTKKTSEHNCFSIQEQHQECCNKSRVCINTWRFFLKFPRHILVQPNIPSSDSESLLGVSGSHSKTSHHLWNTHENT